MTDQRIAEITARCEAATPGPWTYDERVGCVAVYHGEPANCIDESYGRRLYYADGTWSDSEGCWSTEPKDCANAAFIANARQDIPYLLSQLAAKDAEIERLREICDATRSWIVLCSSWKSGWEKTHKEDQDELANYLDRKLKRQGLCVFDKTVDNGEDRGRGIRKWLAEHEGVESWIVLDDEVFADYEVYGIMPRLVKTSFYDLNGGLQPEHVAKAIELMEAV